MNDGGARVARFRALGGPARGGRGFTEASRDQAPLRFYIGNPSFPIQREFYDVTYEAGVKFHV